MEFIQIEAWPRTEHGKSPSSRLRKEGRIPAVAYGPGEPARSLAISPKSLIEAIKGPLGKNAVLEIKVGGDKPFTALLCDSSHHPLTRELVHADFLHIDVNKPVDVEIPLITTGKAMGITTGGVLRQVFRTIPVRCLPALIPVHIEHDVTPMDKGSSVKASELHLPEGVSVRLPAEQTILAIVSPDVDRSEAAATTEAAPAAAAATEEKKPAAGAGAAAAKPAAGAAAAAKPAAKK
jgi:large subunit ribosomal protein L25